MISSRVGRWVTLVTSKGLVHGALSALSHILPELQHPGRGPLLLINIMVHSSPQTPVDFICLLWMFCHYYIKNFG